MKLKKILSLLLAVFVCVSFAACGATETTEPAATEAVTEATTEAATDNSGEEKNTGFEEKVFVDDENCTFKITEIDPDNEWGYTLKAYLENKTDKNLMYTMEDVSVNGFMCDPFWAETVQAGKKAKSEISFFEEDFAELGIENVEEIEFTLSIYDDDDFEAADLVKETFTLNLK